MKSSKTYLKLLIVVGLVAVVGGTAGTFASFTAETTNNNTFATGTLVLKNTIGATSCLSTGAGTTVDANNSSSTGCATFFNTTVSKPGDTSGANLILKNDGTLAASALTLVATCTPGANTNEPTYTGTGDLCTKLQVTVQQWTDNTFSSGAPVTCSFGAATGNTCDFTDTTKTAGALATQTASTPLSLANSFAAGSEKYYTVNVKLPSDADNTYQGRQAAVALTWKIAQ